MLANEHMSPHIKELLENVNWSYISTASLLDVTQRIPTLRSNQTYQRIFADEMARRFENSTFELTD